MPKESVSEDIGHKYCDRMRTMSTILAIADWTRILSLLHRTKFKYFMTVIFEDLFNLSCAGLQVR